MVITSVSYANPFPSASVGLSPARFPGINSVTERVAQRRRRRELLEVYYSPMVSAAAMPSAVDRLVLWRSCHGRHRA